MSTEFRQNLRWVSILRVDLAWNDPYGNVMDALDRIRVHISKSCLSGIPPGCGTNRNENLHKIINPFFSRCRIGIPLALALLTILFHRHNKRLLDTQPLPVLHARALKSTSLPNEEHFGVIDKDGKKTGWIFEPILKSAPDVSMLSVVELNFPPSVEEHVTISDIYALLFKAITTLQVIEEVDRSHKHKSFKNVMVQMAPFMSALVSNFNIDQLQDQKNCEEHKRRLKSVVHSCGYKLFEIVPDGNCCFAAIAFALLTQQDLITSKQSSFFVDNQLPLQSSQEELARILRKKAVEEWLLNPEDYQGFLTDSNVVEQAPKFLQEGYYHGELANTMVTNVSNMLGIPVVVFSSAMHHPIIFITPKVLQVSVPIYLAFMQFGPGHYSGICAADDTTDDHSYATNSPSIDFKCKCYCGRNDKSSPQDHCNIRDTKYGTIARCRCVRFKMKCSEQCKCKSCKNPFGQRQPDDSKPKSRKSRKKHNWQKKIDKSVIF